METKSEKKFCLFVTQNYSNKLHIHIDWKNWLQMLFAMWLIHSATTSIMTCSYHVISKSVYSNVLSTSTEWVGTVANTRDNFSTCEPVPVRWICVKLLRCSRCSLVRSVLTLLNCLLAPQLTLLALYARSVALTGLWMYTTGSLIEWLEEICIAPDNSIPSSSPLLLPSPLYLLPPLQITCKPSVIFKWSLIFDLWTLIWLFMSMSILEIYEWV